MTGLTVQERLSKAVVADFETTTVADDCRVWGWGVCPVSLESNYSDVTIGSTIESFIDYIREYCDIVYFHNLKFDAGFIFDYLLKNGYKSITGKKVKPGEFSSLISWQGQHYSVRICFHTGERVELRDSLKKFPNMSVDDVAKAFQLPLNKLSIDYSQERSLDHKLTDEERRYIAHDVIIISRALAEQFREGMIKLTIGSDSLEEYIKLFGGEQAFRRCFPLLDLTEDAFIRQGYRGGWTLVKPGLAKKRIDKSGIVLDVNSLYPYIMRTRRLPYGYPRWFAAEPPKRGLWIAKATLLAVLKPDHLPTIQARPSNIFSTAEYITATDEPLELTFTSVDFALWNKHYDIEVLSWEGGFSFLSTVGLFNKYIDKWHEIKLNSDGSLRLLAKLHLNSLYGKFATNPVVSGKRPVLRNGAVGFELIPEETRDPVYSAMGAFITAYARELTITAAQENFERFCYADTDSLHLIGDDLPNLAVGDELGEWKLEGRFTQALYWRSKCYVETIDGVDVAHIAGLPSSVAQTITIDDFKDGAVFTGKLLPKRVPGGIVLEEVEYTLKG